MPAPSADLALLTAAAKAAGQIAMGYFRHDPQTWEKPGAAGPVTEADLKADAYLRDTLLGARPGYGWLSEETEESAESLAARLAARRTFIVDPLDGTRAFIAGEPSWAVALAIVEAGQVTNAVVHLPVADKTYAATRGQGAHLNGAPIRAASNADLSAATVLAAAPAMTDGNWPGGLPQMRRSYRPALAYRAALVAEGRYDAMVTLRPTWEWDAAAGSLLITEAGGQVSDRHGAALRFNTQPAQVDGLLAAGGVFDALRSRLAP